jgi:hypothetical protein
VQQGQALLPRPAPSSANIADVPMREWVVAVLLFGLLLVVGIREGGFWHPDALMAAFGSMAFLVAAIVANPLDRRSLSVVVALILLAAWWGIRAATTESLGDVLPLGASCLAFASAFAAVRPLRGPTRQLAGLGVACLGAAGSLVGFAGLVWRWFPMAMPAQGLWRLSTTLTYSDAAGLALGMCLLVALGVDRHPWLARISVCLCCAGLLATQSRGAYVAFLCACAIVPWRRYLRFLVSLLAGVALGTVAIASSPNAGNVPLLAFIFVGAIGISLVPARSLSAAMQSRRIRIVAVCLALGALVVLAVSLHHEIGLRAFAPSDQDRSIEWSTAWHQWWSAPFFGVGPDHLLVSHAADGTYAYFAHNEYLQIAADAGAIGLALLLAVAVAVFRAIRRFDVMSSCACATLVCFAVGGAFDYDWHLAFLGFLGGWCAGLAASAHWAQGEQSQEPDRVGHRARHLERSIELLSGTAGGGPAVRSPSHG